MSYLATGKDLREDALFLSGEPDTGSDYESRVYEWMTVVQRCVVSGGPLGPLSLPPAEWYWARAWPRGAIQMVQPVNVPAVATAAFTTGSFDVTLTGVGGLAIDIVGYRILRTDTPARHMIAAVNSTVFPTLITLREPWTGPTITDTNWIAYPDTYDLPTDFVRGCSPLFVYAFPDTIPTSLQINVVDPVDLERMYPQCFPLGSDTATGSMGLPIVAARVSESKLRFSHFLNSPSGLPLQLEFEYIRRPDVIAEGTIPLIPIQHRRILSYGVAALILDDKDDSAAESLYQKTQGQYQAMLDEHRRDMRRMSTNWGRIIPSRMSGYRDIMMTDSGLPVYIW